VEDNKKTILFVCSYNTISGGLIAIFEHAYRLKLRGYSTYVTFKFTDNQTPYSVFPHYTEVNIIDYGSMREFDIVIATFWNTVYDLIDFKADHYVYFCQSDERLFYDQNDPKSIWAGLTYSMPELHSISSALWLANRLAEEFSAEVHHAACGILCSNFFPRAKTKKNVLRVLIEGSGKTWFKRIEDSFKVVQDIPNIEVWYVTNDGYVSPAWKPDRVFKKIPHDQMPEIYQSCDILVKMSEIESFGLPNLEMMGCGGSVITTAFTGQEEYAIDGENSFVVPIGDVETARDKVLQLIANSELRKKFGENGVRTAEARDWNILKPDFADALEKIEQRHPQGNAKRVLPKLETLSRAYHAHESTLHKLKYLENWKSGVIEREKTLPFRIAHKVRNFLK
jgi:glycosyltransferase involved in cell wall biosynthesis